MLAGGYLAVWTAFSAPLFFVPALPWEIALALAAAYQITPLKKRCLAVCRAPFARIVHRWRDGLGGAFRTGVENGLWCAGCCVGLMVLVLAVMTAEHVAGWRSSPPRSSSRRGAYAWAI